MAENRVSLDVDGIGRVEDRWIGLKPSDFPAFRVHRVDRAREFELQEVPDETPKAILGQRPIPRGAQWT